MKKIAIVEEHIAPLKEKLDIGAKDWTKKEKECIEKAYFEITKVSVGFGRTVDTGCSECVQSAVNIINNYIALTVREVEKPETSKDWRETVASIDAEAVSHGFEFPKGVKSKADKIQALEEYFASLAEEVEEEEEEEDLLGGEPTKEQLAEFISAKTGETVNPDDYTYEELLESYNDLENGEEN